MIYTPKTKIAMKLCFEKHKDQKDTGGIPYVFHPWHVAESMDDEDSTCVALMHDLIEDTDITIKQIKDLGFNDNIIEALRCLTKKKNENYFKYIDRVSQNKLAIKVKMSDLRHNMDLTRLEKVTDKDKKREEKYQKALELLKQKI